MIEEAYTSFEIAKLLKEKGFDEPCRSYFIDSEGDYRKCTVDITNKNCSTNEILRPTHQMAVAFIRKKYNIDIEIQSAVGSLGIKVYIPYISTYKPYILTDIDKHFGLTEDDVKHRVIQKKRPLYFEDDDKNVIKAHRYFKTFEEAVEAALIYTLENLI